MEVENVWHGLSRGTRRQLQESLLLIVKLLHYLLQIRSATASFSKDSAYEVQSITPHMYESSHRPVDQAVRSLWKTYNSTSEFGLSRQLLLLALLHLPVAEEQGSYSSQHCKSVTRKVCKQELTYRRKRKSIMDSEAMERSSPAEAIQQDLEAGLTSPLLPAGSLVDGCEPDTRTTTATDEEEEDVEQGREVAAVGTNFMSRMREVVHFWWSSSELTPFKPKLYISRFFFLIAFAVFLLVALCGAVILTYIATMLVLVPRVVVVNYLVDPYLADSPEWGPSMIALVSALVLGALFLLDDWAERTYGKEWFGFSDWNDSWICMAAQVVLLYLFFETVYISLSTFILSFLSSSPKIAAVGFSLVTAGPVNVLAVLIGSATVAIVLSIFVLYTQRKLDCLAAARSNDEYPSSSMKSFAWDTLVLVDTVLRVIHYIFVFIILLCCIYFIVYGSYKLCTFIINHLIHAFHLHDGDLPDVIPFPSLD
ncbi:hypothetical protein R1sor_007772 [Riccia sorocarpa]|uniref:Transmembrane protein n=1 Tax=Riccia sorocarpa TaxID=122646 RepID=A0ABD3HVK8_9MARC